MHQRKMLAEVELLDVLKEGESYVAVATKVLFRRQLP